MSFILDALKKSESERQRQNGPSLYEVRATTPRMRLPLWAVAIVVLLGVNLSIVTWMLLHRQSAAQAAATETPAAGMAGAQHSPAGYAQAPAGGPWQSAAPQQPMVPQQALTQPGMSPQVAAQPGVQQQGTYQYPQSAYPPNTGATPPTANSSPSYPATVAGTQTPAPGAVRQAGEASPGSGERAGADASPEPAGGNADDYAPAVEQAPGSLSSHVRRATESGLPLYPESDVASAAGLPVLHLDFWVYSVSPQERFVLINMHRLREGDSGPEGERVEAITTDGAVISRGGSKYFLPRS